MFTKEERSKFPYWFAHWCAYNMTALVLKNWKFKYLFHDFEKPWLRLFLPYPKVQQWHRNHNKHHIEYWLKHNKADWDGMVIDWECSRHTKEAQPLDAFGQFKVEYGKLEKMVSPVRLQDFKVNIEKSLLKMGLMKRNDIAPEFSLKEMIKEVEHLRKYNEWYYSDDENNDESNN